MFFQSDTMAPPAVLCNYELKRKEIGKGSYSSVFEAKNKKNGLHYAIKQYKKRIIYGMEENLQNEFDILKSISGEHPNVLTLVDYFQTENCYYLVTDLAQGGELFSIITQQSKLLEIDTKSTLNSVLLAIQFLHQHNIVHRDLKPENILFSCPESDFSQLVIADFGLAKFIPSGQNSKAYDVCGTLSYMAPEIFERDVGHSFPVDLWAIGVMTYFMLCGFLPFDCETDEETKQAIKSRDFGFDWYPEYWNHISTEAKSFIESCFVLDPTKRINASGALNHPFVTENPTPISKVESVTSMTRLSPETLQKPHTSSYLNLRECLSNMKLPGVHPASLSNTHFSVNSSSSLGNATLQGAYCESPQLFSNLNSPEYSLLSSRISSTDNMVQMMSKSNRIQRA